MQAAVVVVGEVAAKRAVEFRGGDPLRLTVQREVALLSHRAWKRST
jgi:hypothetical protein